MLYDWDANRVWNEHDRKFILGEPGDIPYAIDAPPPCNSHDQSAGIGVLRGNQWHNSPDDLWWMFGVDDHYSGVFGIAPSPATWNGVLVAYEKGVFSVDVERAWWAGTLDRPAVPKGVVTFDFAPAECAGKSPVLPVIGRWQREYGERLGVYCEGTWLVDYDGNNEWNAEDRVYHFGAPGDVPVVADFTPGGADEIGTFNGGNWRIDSNGNREWDDLVVGGDEIFFIGMSGDLPVVGRDGWYRDCPN
jgi:hypothetical protein